MATRTILISAYGNSETACFENELLVRLVDRFVDELKPWEKALYEEEGEGSQDLWYAEWDAEKGELSTNLSGTYDISVRVPGCIDPVQYALPALKVLLDSNN